MRFQIIERPIGGADEIFRTRDVVVLAKGDAYTVTVDSTMRATGWPGGQGVQWIDSPIDDFKVSYSVGEFGGFLLWGSNEPSDQFISYTENQPTYGFAVLCAGGWVISTSTYEKYTYISRTFGGPLVPIVYSPSARLRFSLRGLFTVEDEWTLSGDPRAPNELYVGQVAQVPSPATKDYLGVETTI